MIIIERWIEDLFGPHEIKELTNEINNNIV